MAVAVRTFFDSNVIVYAHDRAEEAKRARAIALMESHVLSNTLVVSTQVLLECYNALRRKAFLNNDAAYEIVEALADEQVVDTNADLVLRAIQLAQRHQLSHWDGLIVQAALDAGCTVLYTEDLQAGQRFGDLEVVNPFDDAVHEARAAYAAKSTRPARKKR
jgi:predicted nucleic acid-binding protein